MLFFLFVFGCDLLIAGRPVGIIIYHIISPPGLTLMQLFAHGCLPENYLLRKNKARRFRSGEPFQGKITSCPFCPVLINERKPKRFLHKIFSLPQIFLALKHLALKYFFRPPIKEKFFIQNFFFKAVRFCRLLPYKSKTPPLRYHF